MDITEEDLPAAAPTAAVADAPSSSKRQKGDYGEAARRNFEMHAARETSRQAQLSQLKMAVEQGEVLSKNAQKRLIKLEHRGERREKTKAERQRLKHARREGNAEPAEAAAPAGAMPPLPQPATAPRGAEHHAAAWDFWRRIGAPRTVLAPMVNQSERAFRLLARQHGAALCFTPMLHSTLFATSEHYRLDNFDASAQDRPLITQFCGDDPATLLAAASLAQQGECDAIDLNCGCPQAIARRGHYGAFLLDEPDLIVRIVETLAAPGALRVPVMVKMRLLPSLDDTIALATRLQAAGASALTLHGRTREQKCRVEADWAAIAAVKRALSIPLIANGGIERHEDLERCLQVTGADAVMVSEAALENPAIFAGAPTTRATQLRSTREYITLARAHPPRSTSVVKSHLFKLLYLALQTDAHKPLRERLGAATDLEAIFAVAEEACAAEEAVMLRGAEGKPAAEGAPAAADADAAGGVGAAAGAAAEVDAMHARCDVEGCERVTWYRRHRPYPGSTVPVLGPSEPKAKPEATVSLNDIHERAQGAGQASNAGALAREKLAQLDGQAAREQQGRARPPAGGGAQVEHAGGA